MPMKYCKLTNDQVVWIETDKRVSVQKFLGEKDYRESYLVMYNESLGDAVKRYDIRLKKFIGVPPYMHVYLRKDDTIAHISEEHEPTEDPELKHRKLATMTAIYYFENGLPLGKDVERYITI
jgi:hypothetical protein